MSRRFLGKTVIITGGSAGVGAASARRFAAEGARLVLVARGQAALEALAKELPCETLTIAMDVSDLDAGRKLFARTVERFGNVHVLVNNAGFNARGSLEQVNVDDAARIVDVNLRAPVVLSRLALPHLREAGGGAIVNVASLAGRIPLAQEATYCATKFGLRALSLSLAEELRGTGISVSVVSPGPIDTAFLGENLNDVPDIVLSQPMSSADQVAELILDCAADGRPERVLPRGSGVLTTLGYLLPAASRALKPMMERRGRRAKARYRDR